MKTTMLVTLLVGILLVSGIASAFPDIEWVKINDDQFDFADSTSNVLQIERGEQLDIRVKLNAFQHHGVRPKAREWAPMPETGCRILIYTLPS